MTSPTPATGPDTQQPLTPASDDVRGRFLWYDLMTPDVASAVQFYSAATGWTTTPFSIEGVDGTYTMWTDASGAPIGGVMALPPEQVAAGTPPHWIAYIGTPDVDAAHAEAERLGARTYVAPRDIPTVGRFAVLADPQGATFALYTPQNAVGPEPEKPAVGGMSWHELYTSDLDAAWAFYTQLFGWNETGSMDMGPMGVYRMYGRGARMYGGMMNRASEQQPVAWNLYVRVPSLDASLDAVRSGGGQVIMGPQEVPGGDVVAICTDPRGGAFGLHEVRSA
jgi:uncharacterized protein